MGRGRAKAKQTKVARDLKYRTVSTDLAELERELRGEPEPVEAEEHVPDKYEELAARYGAIDEDYEDQSS